MVTQQRFFTGMAVVLLAGPLALSPAHAYVPDVGPGKCVYNCDVPDYPSSGGSSSYSYDSAYANAMGQAVYTVFNQLGQSIADSWAAAAAEQARLAAEAKRTRQQALGHNDRGNSYFVQGRWDEAVSEYENALQYSPGDSVIQKNLRRTKAFQIMAYGREAHARGDWQGALDYYKKAVAYAPEDRDIRKAYRLARAKQMRDQEFSREAQLLAEMEKASQTLQSKIDRLTGELESSPLTAAERAGRLESMRRLREKGVAFKDDIPVPQPKPEEFFFQIPKLPGKSGFNPAVDAVNQGLKQLDSAAAWTDRQYTEIKDLLRGEIQNRLPGGKLKSFKEGVESLKEKLGGEHEKTARGLFEHMEQGVQEAASPGVRGSTDEKVDAFIQRRADGYRGMARGEIESNIKGSIQQLPGASPDVPHEAASTTTPILGKKSYAVQRAQALNADR